jgi:hypothetical protein
MRRIALVTMLLALVVPVAATAEEPVSIPWTTLLPALPSPAGHSGGPVPGCKKATLKCVNREVRMLRRTRNRFGCDHRAVFATTYLTLTKVLRRTMKADAKYFADRRALIYEDVVFADVYFNTLKAYEQGKKVDPAWKIALDTAMSGDGQGAGDMLLGINAHVQNDMPFVLAAITLRNAKGTSRKPDHDKMNEVLNDAFDEVVKEIATRFDPLTALETYELSPVTDYFGIELVRIWRESVWRNAERLVNAKTPQERQLVANSIHGQAEVTAQAIRAATIGPPGYRAQRDAYCAAQVH